MNKYGNHSIVLPGDTHIMYIWILSLYNKYISICIHTYIYIFIYYIWYAIHLHTLKDTLFFFLETLFFFGGTLEGKIHQSEVTSLCTTPEMVKCDRYVAFKSSGGGGEWRFVKKTTWGMGCVVFFFFLMEGSLDTKFGSINEVWVEHFFAVGGLCSQGWFWWECLNLGKRFFFVNSDQWMILEANRLFQWKMVISKMRLVSLIW